MSKPLLVTTVHLHKNVVGGKRKDLIEPFLMLFTDLNDLTVKVEVVRISGSTATLEVTTTDMTTGYLTTAQRHFIRDSVENYLYESHL